MFFGAILGGYFTFQDFNKKDFLLSDLDHRQLRVRIFIQVTVGLCILWHHFTTTRFGKFRPPGLGAAAALPAVVPLFLNKSVITGESEPQGNWGHRLSWDRRPYCKEVHPLESTVITGVDLWPIQLKKKNNGVGKQSNSVSWRNTWLKKQVTHTHCWLWPCRRLGSHGMCMAAGRRRGQGKEFPPTIPSTWPCWHLAFSTGRLRWDSWPPELCKKNLFQLSSWTLGNLL